MPNDLIRTEPATEHGDRSVSMIWEVSKTTDGDGVVTRELAVLTAMHTGRRSFSASLTRQTETKDPRSPFTSRGFMLFDSIRIAEVPVARYSARALADFCGAAIIALITRADEPKIAAVFGVEAAPSTDETAWTPPVSILGISA